MIDFGDDEDDVTEEAYEQAIFRVTELMKSIKKNLADGRKGEILRNGVQVAILGPPNAGKSSLLNILARRPAAIVSSIAGTTRDIVQVPLNICGYPVLVSDTAGIRETEDIIEQEGVLRAHQAASNADIRVIMLDVQDTIEKILETEYNEYLTQDTILVLNKSDQVDINRVRDIVKALENRCPLVKLVSCTKGEGIDDFIETLGTYVQEK
jgi:tRNA modification GTPase